MPRRTLTVEKIIAAAVAFADREGFEALSMRKLAHELQVTAMSLYNHVENKDELLDLMLNAVVAEIDSPYETGDWDVMMRRRAHSLRDVLIKHQWASTLLISRIVLGEAIYRDSNASIGCLLNAGFSFAQADWARNAIDSHVYGYTIQELNYPVAPQHYQATAADYLSNISKEDYPHMYEGALQVSAGVYDGQTQFGFGLELILDGLKRWKAEGGSVKHS